MTFDPTKPVQTRDGRPARILCTDRWSDNFPIVALVNEGGCEEPRVYTRDGKWSVSGALHNRDLVNVPEKRTLEYWLNVYPGQVPLHGSKTSADENAGIGRIACIHIKQEYTVGEGL